MLILHALQQLVLFGQNDKHRHKHQFRLWNAEAVRTIPTLNRLISKECPLLARRSRSGKDLSAQSAGCVKTLTKN